MNKPSFAKARIPMNRIVLSTAIVLSLSTFCFAQEKKSGFEFLKQFDGKWKSAAYDANSKNETAPTSQGTVIGKTIGEFWLVLEHSGQFGEMSFNAIQTLGYDKEKEQYVGTWIDSVKSHMWHYTGKLDENQLILEAEGPDWNDETRMRKYRDIYEFKSENEIIASSQMKNNKGEWETFMTGTMQKVKAGN